MTTATNAAPDTVIAPPPLTPPRISLLTSSDVVTDNSSRWEAGYTYDPEGCGEANVGLICPAPGTIKEFCPNPTLVDFQPFYIYGPDKCSTFGFKARDFYGRATRKLLAAESWFLENEIMLDTLGLGNPAIATAGANTVTTGALPPHVALARLEDALGDCNRGTRSMIHVRPGILALLVYGQQLRREGNVWLTPLDNIVVPGRGYPGTGPLGQPIAANSEWMYATSMVQIRRSQIVLTPDPAEVTAENPYGIPPAAVDRRVNDIFVLAERIISAAWDPSCCWLAAETQRTI